MTETRDPTGEVRLSSYLLCLASVVKYFVTGPSKPKDEGMGGWNGAGSNHWGGGNNAGNGGAGWGPPPAKPGAGAGGGWGAGPGGPPAGRPGQWPENDSPTMGRRFDDGGTSIWGGKAPAGPGMQAGPPGGEYFHHIFPTSSFIDHKTLSSDERSVIKTNISLLDPHSLGPLPTETVN